ncbi:MAG: sulfurtransferase [Alphaproteobacteria bacterium]|nr:sulfurtransferase [Alphaproteobacteria bacterium]
MTQAAEQFMDVATLRQWLGGGGEVAFLDVREEGQHGAGHPLLAVNAPYSRLELLIGQLVPRRSCPTVLIDDVDGVAAKAARRLAALGYNAVHVLDGGVGAWSGAGHPLFPSTNVPSKAFAEIVEHEYGTPAMTATELDRRRRAGERIVVLDSRPLDEYARFHVPGAVTCPGAELVLRFADLVPDPGATVVVSCAGRTRGIIGAQSLRTAGVPNPIFSLEGGTQAWRLAGLELEHGPTTKLKPSSPQAVAAARERAEAVAARFSIRRVDRATLETWRGEPRRTTFVLDVRTPEEFAAGHLRGSVSAPGGQLVQAIDRWVGVRGARLVLVDDAMIRAIMTAQWLKQMGWDVAVLGRPFDGASLATGFDTSEPALPAVARITATDAAHWLDGGAAAVAIMASAEYRKAHPEEAVWAIRPRVDRLPTRVLQANRIAVFADDEGAGALAATDLAEIAGRAVALVEGGNDAWRAAGRPFTASPDDPPDTERIDTIFWNHDRHAGNREAMRAYLRWETELPGEIARDGLAGFQIGA